MKAKRVKGLDPVAPLRQNAARIVEVRLGELRSFAVAALEAGAAGEQHDMRIAAKRLRYVLEATGFCFGSAGDEGRKAARRLQEILGELHDCDVMLPRIDRHSRELRAEDVAAVRRRAGEAADLDPRLAAAAPSRATYRGLAVLAVHFETRRRLLHDRFVELWNELEADGTWRRLEAAIERTDGGSPVFDGG